MMSRQSVSRICIRLRRRNYCYFARLDDPDFLLPASLGGVPLYALETFSHPYFTSSEAPEMHISRTSGSNGARYLAFSLSSTAFVVIDKKSTIAKRKTVM